METDFEIPTEEQMIQEEPEKVKCKGERNRVTHKLPVKETYTEEELMDGYIPRSCHDRDKIMVDNIMRFMFERYGKSKEWAIEHEREDLPLLFILHFTEKQYNEFVVVLRKIVYRHFYWLPKKLVDNTISFFLFNSVLTYINEKNEKEVKDSVCRRINIYEDKNGELTYPDGWEKELKEWCNYARKEEGREFTDVQV